MNKWIKCSEQLPPIVSEDTDFGSDYEIKYISESGKIEIAVTEWLWDKTWNWTWPVIAWREITPIINFSDYKNQH